MLNGNPYPPNADPASRPLELCLPQALPQTPNQLMLGVFLPIGSWGHFPTSYPSPSDWTYACNREITMFAEKAGFHFVLPAARWKGAPGDRIDWRGVSLDPITLAAALVEATERIVVMTTLHTNVYHPVVAAKLCADLDQISSGRCALNIVSGWNEDEFKSMGMDLLDHRTRYDYSREWLHVVEQIWRDGECSFKGKFFNIQEAVGRPRPVQTPRPLIVNAGQSRTGIAFAAENADYAFSYFRNAENFRKACEGVSKSPGFIGLQKVIVGEDRATARQTAELIWEQRDVTAIRSMLVSSGAAKGRSIDDMMADEDVVRNAVFEDAVIGDPSEVADELARRVVESRCAGICLTFFDYLQELRVFANEVVPRLERNLSKHGIAIS